ncbi:hypothetical protein K438DRAFT_1782209 [Mycena galopus ATCC 62051]|nr:hypothetical protein K438DRAFT_1782209 [Mycena galopus ATCC 62051]
MKDLDELDYGLITINGRIWGGQLRQILVCLYFLSDEACHAQGAKFETVDFDITPGDDVENTDALDKTLDNLGDYLGSVTLGLITQTVFEICFPFDLKWDDFYFYKSFSRGLRLDALHRHNRYNNAPVPEPQFPKVDVSKRRQTNQPTTILFFSSLSPASVPVATRPTAPDKIADKSPLIRPHLWSGTWGSRTSSA